MKAVAGQVAQCNSAFSRLVVNGTDIKFLESYSSILGTLGSVLLAVVIVAFVQQKRITLVFLKTLIV